MNKVVVSTEVKAPVEALFKSWHDEFADIYKFNPNLSDSHLLTNSPVEKGLGAMRQCDMADGKNWIRERVTEFQENQKITVDIYEGSMPLKTAYAEISFKSLSATRSQTTMAIMFEPKLGWLGRMMVPMMKKQFSKMLQALLDANASYVETGKQVNPNQDQIHAA